ncbi:GNAT family N-acetyltransferase [Alkalibacterium pelagium]|uniref:Ribosomal protein S18 acetylase RimI n=1 Tax=Alkalibacterium pelagium TaxID=426702 RepID=A0A1H7HRL3_9LACT|nr:GNAT family N-acetyltransferase [Alkalibacterium pelagium]GEN50382.1 hypothetical protein APE02nite_10470 [Alkalibacterium pelagium]SEK52327.1 Ribosomal protein S18 acetylase RimI [Alkalibacterium pelagium]
MEMVTDHGRLSRLIKSLQEESGFSLFTEPFNVEDYATKLIDKGISMVFVENGEDAGLVSFYANDSITHIAYIALIGVLAVYQGTGIAHQLMDICISLCIETGMKQVKLEVSKGNSRAIRFYENYDFNFMQDAADSSVVMIKKIGNTKGLYAG